MIILQDLKIIIWLWHYGSRNPSQCLLKSSKLLMGTVHSIPTANMRFHCMEEPKMSQRAHPARLWLVGLTRGYEGATHLLWFVARPLKRPFHFGIPVKWAYQFHLWRLRSQATRSTLTSPEKWHLSIMMRRILSYSLLLAPPPSSWELKEHWTESLLRLSFVAVGILTL